MAMRGSCCCHEERLGQRLALQDRAECTVIPLDTQGFPCRKSHVTLLDGRLSLVRGVLYQAV